MNNPKFEQKIKQNILNPQTRQSAEYSSGYGFIIQYYPTSNTADVMMSQKDSVDTGTIYKNVPCPTNIGIQTVAPEPGRHCFAAGTLVLTSEGLKPIENIVAGDLVLTHRNRWRPVLYSGKTGDSETVTISGRGASITCTMDHRFYASQVINKKGSGYKLSGYPRWIQARELIGNAWSSPLFVESLPIPLPGEWKESDLPDNFWWVIGRWVGDGWTSNKGPSGKRGGGSSLVGICCGKHEIEVLGQQLKRTGWKWNENEESTIYKFRVFNESLRVWLRKHFGTRALDKQIPAWLIGASKEIRKSFLEGYISADGCVITPKKGRSFTSITTISPALAYGTRLLAIGLGYSATVRQWEQKSFFIAGRSVRSVQKPYSIRWPLNKIGEKYSQVWQSGDHLWGRVTSIKTNAEVSPVYDLEVDEDHSFIANGIVVHNCWVDFKGNSDHYPVITHFFNNAYNKIDYAKQTVATNNIPRFQTQM